MHPNTNGLTKPPFFAGKSAHSCRTSKNHCHFATGERWPVPPASIGKNWMGNCKVVCVISWFSWWFRKGSCIPVCICSEIHQNSIHHCWMPNLRQNTGIICDQDKSDIRNKMKEVPMGNLSLPQKRSSTVIFLWWSWCLVKQINPQQNDMFSFLG